MKVKIKLFKIHGMQQNQCLGDNTKCALQRRSKVNNLSFHLQKLEKEQFVPRTRREKQCKSQSTNP